MRVRHPYSLDDDAPSPDATVHWGGRRRWAEVDDDGTFEVPDDANHDLDTWADGYGYDLADLVVREGPVSGRSGDSDADATDGSEDDDDVDEASASSAHEGDSPQDAGTCAATTASGDPCSNPAGDDGYCHLASHGPEG